MRAIRTNNHSLIRPILVVVLLGLVSLRWTSQGDAVLFRDSADHSQGVSADAGARKAARLSPQAAITVANLIDSGPGSLRDAIASAAPNDIITIPAPGGTISLNSSLVINKNLTINGPGTAALTISGLTVTGSNVRVFLIKQGLVTISSLTIANGGVKGGDGGTGGGGGGGGAGMGGAVFINSGFVTFVDVAFSSNSAAGGNGGSTGYAPAGGGGGGGFADGTAGNPGMQADSDGNGGAGAGGASFGTPSTPRGDRGEDNPCSPGPDAPSGTGDGTGGSGAGRVGFDFGGDCILGGAGLQATVTDLSGGKGGAGAFAGGGGAGGGGGGNHVSNNIFGFGGHGSNPNLQTGGSGGFGGGGGGGGGNTNGDIGGFGGTGGQFGGNGAQGSRCRECGGGGGGGAGLGGAIFIRTGALILNTCSFNNDSVIPGTAGPGGLTPATNGQTAGRAVFVMDTADIAVISTSLNGEEIFPAPTGSTALVTNLNDIGLGSLRDAIDSAQPNTTITFQDGLSGTINLSQSLLVKTSMTIIGPGHDRLTITGGGFERPFFVSGILVKISGLTIENGHAKGGDGGCGGSGGGGGAGMGGAMFINSGNVTLKDVFFNNNSAIGGTGGGGASTCGNGAGGGGGGFGFNGAGANGGNADGDGNSGPGSSGGELGGTAPPRADRGHNAGGFPSTCEGGNDGVSTNGPGGDGAGAAGGGRTGIAANGDCGTGGLGGNAGFAGGGGGGGGGTTDAGATGEQSGGMGGFGGGGGGGGGRTRGDGQPGPGGLGGQFGGSGTVAGLCRECGGGGGGGAGLGGAVFIRAGILLLDNCSFSGDSVTAGQGGVGDCLTTGCVAPSGQAAGRAVFAVDGASVTQCGSDLHGEDMYSSSAGVLAAPNTSITVPAAVCTNSTGNVASAPDAGAGATYLWSITDGLLTSGQGTATITWSALNISPVTIHVTVSNVGNCAASGSVSVTVKRPPVAVCQNITVPLGATNTVIITGPQVDGGSTSECGIASRTVSPDTFNCSNLGPNLVTFTVTDIAGNKSTCNAIVTVVDITPPVITCPANIGVNTDPGL